MGSINDAKASLFVDIASYLSIYPFVECTFVLFIITGYFIDAKIDSHLKVMPNNINNINIKLKWILILYKILLVFFIVFLYNDFFMRNSEVILNNGTSTYLEIEKPSEKIIPSPEKFPSLEFYKTMMTIFLGIFAWSIKIANDKVNSKKYISCLFLFFMSYCLFSGIIFIEAISHYYITQKIFDQLAIGLYIEGIVTNFIVLLFLLAVLSASKSLKSVHFS